MSQVHRLKDESFVSGIFKSHDPIENFKIKITLEKSNQICGRSRDGKSLGDFELQPLSPDEKEIEEKIFSWQEKVFSPREIMKYSDLANCSTTLEKKYYKDVQKLMKKRPVKKRLFTYINSDKCLNLSEVKEDILNPQNENYLTDKLRLNFRHTNQTDLIPKSNLVQKHKYKKTQTENSQYMTVMADINELDKLGCTDNEIPLCTIVVTTDGTILITPDFNKAKQPYEIEIENGKKTLFRYWIEHVSDSITKEEADKEKNMHQELHSQHFEMIKKSIGEEFEMPSSNYLKLYLYGEIVSARDFGWKNLYVNYMLDLPQYWTTDQQLTGSTVTASTTVLQGEEVACFSYPFNIELNLDLNQLQAECLRWPQLLLQVWSKDFWNRYRVEGYGHVTIPSIPGIYNWRIETWKPISSSIVGQLGEFFLGSYSELDDLAFLASSTEKCHPLNRVGISTQSSGRVDIKMQIIHHSLNFLGSDVSSASLRALISKLGSMSIQSSFISILEAFQRARQRMLTARESLFSSSTLDSSETCAPLKETTDSCSSNTPSSSSVLKTVAIIHNKPIDLSNDDSLCESSKDVCSTISEESLSSSSVEKSSDASEGEVASTTVNPARMRRRQKHVK